MDISRLGWLYKPTDITFGPSSTNNSIGYVQNHKRDMHDIGFHAMQIGNIDSMISCVVTLWLRKNKKYGYSPDSRVSKNGENPLFPGFPLRKKKHAGGIPFADP